MGLVLTVGVPPARAAAWIEGFLAGGGLLLVHDERLLSLVDGWLAGIPADTFVEVLPLLRRTFAELRRRRSGAPSASGSATCDRPAPRPARPRRGTTSSTTSGRPWCCRPCELLLGPRRAGARRSGGCDVTRRRRRAAAALAAGARRRARTAPASALTGSDARIDAALAALYDAGDAAAARTGDAQRPGSAPRRRSVARWLGDIRTLLPVHRRAGHAGRRDRAAQPDPAAAGAGDAGGGRARRPPGRHAALAQPGHAGARPSRPPGRWSRKVVADLERRVAQKTRAAVTGALNRAARINRPAAPRHRLEPHHPRQPQALPARARARSCRSG